MSTISQRQNEPLHIHQLRAQRRLYDEVRRTKWIRIIGVLVLNTLWIVYASLTWHSELLVVFGSGILLVIEFFTKKVWQDPIHKKAAYVQELFDCEVLDLTWNDDLYEPPPAADEVARWADRYNEQKYKNAPLSNWYSEKVDLVPLVYGRLCCINSNIDWDVSLRRLYLRRFWISVSGLIVFFSVLIYFWGLPEVNKYWILIASILPIFRVSWDETKGSLEAVENLKDTREKINRKWHDVISGKLAEKGLEQAARQWQNKILDHRKLSPVLPGKYYLKTRPQHEADMNRSSGALAEEVIAALKRRK